MSNTLNGALISGALLTAASGAFAQEFTWEGHLEVGVESVVDSNISGNEFDDPFVEGEMAFGLTYGNVGAFMSVLLEEQTRPSQGIEDLGLYIETLGLEYRTDRFAIAVGKSNPVFGFVWDDAAGYFNDVLGEDYEITGQLGLFGEYQIIEGGVLSASVFYADNTKLSDTFGFNIGQNSEIAGGAGNTGELDNFAVTWRHDFGDSFYHVGARHLSRGQGDASDENGYIIGAGHSLQSIPVDLFGEIAFFDGFGGSGDDAFYGTVSAAYNQGDTSYSALYTYRDDDGAGETSIITLGIDHVFDNRFELGGAVGYSDGPNGAEEVILGASLIIPLGPLAN